MSLQWNVSNGRLNRDGYILIESKVPNSSEEYRDEVFSLSVLSFKNPGSAFVEDKNIRGELLERFDLI